MHKIFRTVCFIMTGTKMDLMHSCTIELNEDIVEFRSNDISIQCPLVLFKRVIQKAAISGGTYLEEDKDNHVILRYTKGFGNKTDKATTMSLSHTNDKGYDLYMISAEATDFDEYLRKLWR